MQRASRNGIPAVFLPATPPRLPPHRDANVSGNAVLGAPAHLSEPLPPFAKRPLAFRHYSRLARKHAAPDLRMPFFRGYTKLEPSTVNLFPFPVKLGFHTEVPDDFQCFTSETAAEGHWIIHVFNGNISRIAPPKDLKERVLFLGHDGSHQGGDETTFRAHQVRGHSGIRTVDKFASVLAGDGILRLDHRAKKVLAPLLRSGLAGHSAEEWMPEHDRRSSEPASVSSGTWVAGLPSTGSDDMDMDTGGGMDMDMDDATSTLCETVRSAEEREHSSSRSGSQATETVPVEAAKRRGGRPKKDAAKTALGINFLAQNPHNGPSVLEKQLHVSSADARAIYKSWKRTKKRASNFLVKNPDAGMSELLAQGFSDVEARAIYT